VTMEQKMTTRDVHLIVKEYSMDGIAQEET